MNYTTNCIAIPESISVDDLQLISFDGRTLTDAIRENTAKLSAISSRSGLRHAMLDPTASLRILSIEGRAMDLSRTNWESELDHGHGLLLLELRRSEGMTIGKLFQP